MRKSLSKPVVVAIALIAFAGAICLRADTEQAQKSGADRGPAAAIRAPQTFEVRAVGAGLEEFRFEPAEVIIQVGDSVRFINETDVLHTVTRNDAPSFDEILEEQGSEVTIQFTEASGASGFDYFCLPHPWMEGRVIVRLPGSRLVRVEDALKARFAGGHEQRKE